LVTALGAGDRGIMLLSEEWARSLLRLHRIGPPLELAAWIKVSRSGIAAGLGSSAIAVPALEGLPQAGANRLAGQAGVAAKARGTASDMLLSLWEMVLSEDLLEVRYGPGLARVTLDDAARFRHPGWARFGFAIDPAGGPYLAKADAIAAIDAGRPWKSGDRARLPVMDDLVVRAYAQAHA
jgi:hypothetical protein